MQVRTPDERNTAELDALQNLTKFYSNWPGSSAVAKTGTNLLLADVLFDQNGWHPDITHVETYGKNLLIEVNARNFSCSDADSIANAANASGFSLIALSSSNDPTKIKICPVTASEPAPAIQNTDLQVASDGQTVGDDGAMSAPNSGLAPVHDTQTVQEKIVADAKDQGLTIVGYLISGQQMSVAYTNGRYRTEAEAIGRLLRVVMMDAPDEITDFRFVMMTDSIPGRAITLHRANVERIANLSGDASELLPVTPVIPVSVDDAVVSEGSLVKYPAFDWNIGPGYQQSFFDPSEPYRFGIYAGLGGSVALSDHFLLGMQTDINIYNTVGSIDRVSNSVLPHVRSDFALYLKHGANSITSLTAQYLTKFAPDVYFLGRAGYIEQMYAGAGGEVYWRPEDKRYSFGASLYEVQQRNFDDLFGFRNYHVLTGHISMYYQSPFKGLNFELHVGRYLAGDYGATFQVTRRFDSGIEIGAYVTLTNVPFSQFGEGSFDKGFIIHIPVDFLAPVNTQDRVALDFSPLTRDGGQRLAGEDTLFYATRSQSEGELLPSWNKVMEP
jgi:hypothetical protein